MNGNRVVPGSISLWYSAEHGRIGWRRVHFGERAVFYPDKHLVAIEKWGPEGASTEEIHIPEGIEEKSHVVLYLNGKCHIPRHVLCSIQQELGVAETEGGACGQHADADAAEPTRAAHSGE